MICGSSLRSGVHETMLTTALRASWNAVGLRRCVEPFLQCWSSASIGLKNWVNRNRSGMVDRNSDARFSLFQSYHNDNYMFENLKLFEYIQRYSTYFQAPLVLWAGGMTILMVLIFISTNPGGGRRSLKRCTICSMHSVRPRTPGWRCDDL